MPLAIYIAFDALAGVDGSARFAFGTAAAAVASVSGPIAPRHAAAEHPIRASIDVHVRPLAAVPATAEKHAAAALRGILERACILAQHPRTTFQIVVQALSPAAIAAPLGPGADVHAHVRLAAQINAAGLALLNAGSVPMRGVVCAVAAAHPPRDDVAVVPGSADSGPGRAPLDGVDAAGCFVFLFGVGPASTEAQTGVPPAKMVWTNYRARPGHAFSAAALAEAERVALEGATEVWRCIKASLAGS